MTTLFDPTSAPTQEARASTLAHRRPSRARYEHEVWHPISWDISEVARFTVKLSAELGSPVNRITLNPASWSEHPRLLPLHDGRCLRIDWFDAAALDEVSVRRGTEPRLTIRLAAPSSGRPTSD